MLEDPPIRASPEPQVRPPAPCFTARSPGRYRYMPPDIRPMCLGAPDFRSCTHHADDAPVKGAYIAKMALFMIPKTLTRQTERSRARTHKPRPSIGYSRRALSGVQQRKSTKKKEIKKIALPAKQQKSWNLKEPCFASFTVMPSRAGVPIEHAEWVQLPLTSHRTTPR